MKCMGVTVRPRGVLIDTDEIQCLEVNFNFSYWFGHQMWVSTYIPSTSFYDMLTIYVHHIVYTLCFFPFIKSKVG